MNDILPFLRELSVDLKDCTADENGIVTKIEISSLYKDLSKYAIDKNKTDDVIPLLKELHEKINKSGSFLPHKDIIKYAIDQNNSQ